MFCLTQKYPLRCLTVLLRRATHLAFCLSFWLLSKWLGFLQDLGMLMNCCCAFCAVAYHENKRKDHLAELQ